MGSDLFSAGRVRSSVFPLLLRRVRNILEWPFLSIFSCLNMSIGKMLCLPKSTQPQCYSADA